MTPPLLATALAAALLALAAPARATGPIPVRVASLQNDLHHLPLWVGVEKGFFKAEGLDVQLAGAFRTGAELVSAFGAGDLDAAYVGQAPVTMAVARRTADLQVLALVNAEGSEIVVRTNDPARRLEDLRGRTLAIPGIGSVQDLLVRKALAAAGLADAVKVIVLRAPEMGPALQSGQIDAFIAWEPHGAQARVRGVGRTLVPSRAIWKGHPCCVLAVGRAFLASQPGAAEALRRAHRRAIEFIRADPAAALAIAARQTGLEEPVLREALAEVTYEWRLSAADELEVVRSLTALGYLDPADPAALVDRLVAPAAREVGR